jgi:predicted aspartyl protease
MRRTFLTVALALMAAGCASGPHSQLETTTPTLSPAQVAELQKNTKTPEELGFQMRVSENGTAFAGVNVVEANENMTVPLVEIASDHPYLPGGRYRAPVIVASVNGRAGVRVMIDSGSNRNLFGYTLAHSLGIPLIAGLKPVTGHGIGGSVEDYMALVPAMQIGSIGLQKVLAMIGPDAQVLSFTREGNAQVMLLGVNALRSLSYLTIDNLHGKVILGAREGYLPDDTLPFMTTATLHWLGELPAVEISIDGREAMACILDTGGDYGMILPRTRAIELGYWTPGKGALTVPGGVGGASLAASYEIKQAKVGGATFAHIQGRTGLVGPDIGGGQAVFLGNAVLRGYRVTFDFKQNTLWLEK